MGEAVREGRKKHGDKAWQKRQGDMESESDEDENGEDEDETEDPGDKLVDVGNADRWQGFGHACDAFSVAL
jgi:hypothetical protein